MSSVDILGLEDFISVSPKSTSPTPIESNIPLSVHTTDRTKSTCLAFFISCTDIEGSNLHPTSRNSAQTLVRGALHMLSQSSASIASRVKSNPSSSSKHNSDHHPSVAIQIHIGQEQQTASTQNLIISDSESKALTAAVYCTERQKSKCPSFQVGCRIYGHVSPEYDRQIMFQIVLPDENANVYGYKTAPVFGSAITSFQKMLCIAQSGNFRHSMKLPIHSLHSASSATCILQFVDIQPQHPRLLKLHRPIFKCFRFDDLLSSNIAQFTTEEAAQVEQTIEIPLEMLRLNLAELEEMRDYWIAEYHRKRIQNCHFESDEEALECKYDVYRVQIVEGRDIRHYRHEEEMNSKGACAQPSLQKNVSSVNLLSSGRAQLVNKWMSPNKSSDFSFFDGKSDTNGKALNLFAVVRYLHKGSDTERVIGRTNTESGTSSPVWGRVDPILKKTPHIRSQSRFSVAAEPFTDVQVSQENELKEFVFYRDSVDMSTDTERISGCLCVQIFDEQYTIMGGADKQFLGQVVLPLESVTESFKIERLMSKNSKATESYATRLSFDDWLDICPTQGDASNCGQIHIRFSILVSCQQTNAPVQRRSEQRESPFPLKFLYAHVWQTQQKINAIKHRMEIYQQMAQEKRYFKSSMDKKSQDLQELPTNLHASYFTVYERQTGSESGQDLFQLLDFQSPPSRDTNPSYVAKRQHVLVTCGAHTAHAMGLNDGGLLELQAEINRIHSAMPKEPNLLSQSARQAISFLSEDAIKESRVYCQNFATKTENMLSSHGKYPSYAYEAEDGQSDAFLHQICRSEMLLLQYQTRKYVAVSQAASTLITCFIACLDRWLALNQTEILEQLANIGFLVGFESLISSQGKELVMLSDAYAAMDTLKTFVFRLFPMENNVSATRIEKSENFGFHVFIPVPREDFYRLPRALQQRQEISITIVLFTQGINEMQSFANIVGHSGVSMQSRINSTSLRTICEYFERFRQFHDSSAAETSLAKLQSVVEGENASYKNTYILLYAADAVRRLNGGRVTYCKSGKDRTAMSVTMEESRFYMDTLAHSESSQTLDRSKYIANVLREFGVRIEIAKRNIGKAKYSFNSIQRKLLPDMYRPPLSTIQDMVTSVTARDS